MLKEKDLDIKIKGDSGSRAGIKLRSKDSREIFFPIKNCSGIKVTAPRKKSYKQLFTRL